MYCAVADAKGHTEPHFAGIDSNIRPGDNALEADVTNLWPNRLIGDARPGNRLRRPRHFATIDSHMIRVSQSRSCCCLSMIFDGCML
jgi:hypothetical protein